MPIPVAMILGLGGSALWGAMIAALNAGKVVVPRIASWPFPPNVLIDPALAELLAPTQAAVARWQALGHSFEDIQVREPAFAVRSSIYMREGVIRIGLPPQNWMRPKAIASAFVSMSENDDDGFDVDDPEFGNDDDPLDNQEITADRGVIRDVRIVWDTLSTRGLDPERIIAHELGHALGYLHCTARLRRRNTDRHLVVQVPKRGHLMHPLYTEGGWSTKGLEAKEITP